VPEPWWDLVGCAFCFAPWVTAVNLAWYLLTDGQTAWWVVNGWLAAAYLAAMIVVRDTPE